MAPYEVERLIVDMATRVIAPSNEGDSMQVEHDAFDLKIGVEGAIRMGMRMVETEPPERAVRELALMYCQRRAVEYATTAHNEHRARRARQWMQYASAILEEVIANYRG